MADGRSEEVPRPARVTRRTTAALVAAGVLFGSMLLAPVQAHVTANNPGHNWHRHYRPLAVQLFLTRRAANVRFFPRSVADNRFAFKNHAHDGLIASFDQLDGLPCTLDGETGLIELSFVGSEASFVCQVPSGAECEDGATQQCGSPPVGVCLGIQTCVDGEWGACTGGTPSEEVCDGRDNNCDGQVDEGGVCDEWTCEGEPPDEFQPLGVVCRQQSECRWEALCTGTSPECPPQLPKENGTPCSSGAGVCQNGVCVPPD